MKAEADTEIEASGFRTIWRVLRALAAHDARVMGRITELRAHRAQPQHAMAQVSEDGAAAEAGAGEQQPATAERSPVDWLQIDARRHAARILQTVELRAFNPRAVEWQRMNAVAAVFHLEHGHLDPSDREKHGAGPGPRLGVPCGAGWRTLSGGLAAFVVPAGPPVFGGVVRR